MKRSRGDVKAVAVHKVLIVLERTANLIIFYSTALEFFHLFPAMGADRDVRSTPKPEVFVSGLADFFFRLLAADRRFGLLVFRIPLQASFDEPFPGSVTFFVILFDHLQRLFRVSVVSA